MNCAEVKQACLGMAAVSLRGQNALLLSDTRSIWVAAVVLSAPGMEQTGGDCHPSHSGDVDESGCRR